MIDRAARRMQSMRPKHAEAYLIAFLELVQDELLQACVPQQRVNDELIALALTIKAKAFRGAMWSAPGGCR
jgi:hypothetical protein